MTVATGEKWESAGPLPEALSPGNLPGKEAFLAMGVTYLDSAAVHPFSRGARRAVMRYLRTRMLHDETLTSEATRERVRRKFAALINANPEEVCLVPSTTAGEHLVLQALEIPACAGRIVTDTLHYPGSFYLHEEMSKAGMDVVWLRPHARGGIELGDMDAAITRNTRLVAVSLVSSVNGFQHDLKRVCEIAHARGALVYADIVQAAGAVPVDVKDSNVDFAACSSYKWLMGDFGVGLLYARQDLLGHIRRTQFGTSQLKALRTHVYPFDSRGARVASYEVRQDATGHFGTGTIAGAALVQLDHSLDYILRLGVDKIQRHRQPLLDKSRVELERLGYPCMTPRAATSPILAFTCRNAQRLEARLGAAKVQIALVDNRFRISPSVFNGMSDVERLIEALS